MKTRVLLSHRARRLFIILHLWLGLAIGLWFSLIGITGSVLAWRGELTAMELRAKFPHEKLSADAKMISLSDAISIGTRRRQSRANSDTPNARGENEPQATTITIPNSRMPFYSVVQGRARRGQLTLIDPYSGRVHPPVNTRETRVGSIQQFHQRLLAGARGYVANGFFNVLAVPLVLSGLWLWWPSNAAQLKARVQVKRGASLKRRLYDLHNVMGIYLYGLLFITTVTGAMLVYQHVAADGGLRAFLDEEDAPPANARPNERGANRPNGNRNAVTRPMAAPGGGRAEPEVPEVTASGARLSNDQILETARGLRPNYELTRLQLPANPNQAVTATFQKPMGLTNNDTVLLNPYNGQIVTANARADGFNIRGWTRLLHLGEFGGVLSKLFYTVTGLVPLGLFLTGAWLWWNKKRKKWKPKTAVVAEKELAA